MTEYEKMIAGQLYDPSEPSLVKMRAGARALLNELNHSPMAVGGEQQIALCGELFGAAGARLWLQPPFYCDYGVNILLGDNVMVNFNCVILDVARVTIGDSVLIGPGVQIYAAAHPLDWKQRATGVEFGKPVTIGNNVWIGGSAVICPGVTIGDRSVVGAGAVVTKDVPEGVLVAGNPAGAIRKL
ncbi:MAG TPA: sugar O-acetyltransferase [bacterium]|nr:sugar O-acetyltransferase [bacterium]